MNRLKKPRANEHSTTTANASNASAVSRTMQLAVGGMKVSRDDGWSTRVVQRKGTWFSAPAAAAPRTQVEQYWAARALVAETLLSAHDRHQGELAQVRRMEEEKRERGMGAMIHANDQRQRRLERLMVMCLAVSLGFVAWLVRPQDRDAKGAGKPSHFTIPILSPFTSVVEHETGVFGTKAVVVFVVVAGIALYVALRRRLSGWRTR